MKNNLTIIGEDEVETAESGALHSVSCADSKRCSDYDSECVDVKDPIHCWFGNAQCERADGYCPLINSSN